MFCSYAFVVLLVVVSLNFIYGSLKVSLGMESKVIAVKYVLFWWLCPWFLHHVQGQIQIWIIQGQIWMTKYIYFLSQFWCPLDLLLRLTKKDPNKNKQTKSFHIFCAHYFLFRLASVSRKALWNYRQNWSRRLVISYLTNHYNKNGSRSAKV